MKYHYLIVGAGFAGCVLAERLANKCDKKVLLIDRRPHIGGNAYDFIDAEGIRVHQYGPHAFHTNSDQVFSYLSQFTQWRPYEHRVRASINGLLVPIPINRTTVNMLLGCSFGTDEEVALFFERERERIPEIGNSEEYVLARVGRRLYELLYREYTKKQWGREPSELAPSICGRLPVRTNADDRYFDDRYQAMPLHGYSELFSRMVMHKNIDIELQTSFNEIPQHLFNELIFTGPIDEYFGFMHGALPYRSLRFEFETIPTEQLQPVAQVNYPNDHPYTRITEFKHITGEKHPHTSLSKEYPTETGDPYYPIPSKESAEIFHRYQAAAGKLSTVHFVGRLAAYQYYNMDQVVAQALEKFKMISRKTV